MLLVDLVYESFFIIRYLLMIFISGHEICLTPDTRLGTCVTIKSCPHLYELLKTRAQEPEIKIFLRKSHCGTINNSPKVCCNTQTNSITEFMTSSPTPITSSSTLGNANDIKGYWHMIHSSSSAATSPANLHQPVTSSPVPITSPKPSNDWNVNHSLTSVPVTSLFASNSTRGNEIKTQSQARNKFALCGKSTRLALNIIGGRNATLGKLLCSF